MGVYDDGETTTEWCRTVEELEELLENLIVYFDAEFGKGKRPGKAQKRGTKR